MAAPCCQSFQKWLSLLLYVSGIVLSSYAFYVERSKSADENYVALCDINENVTCSKVFNSKYGKGFGLISQLTGDEQHPLNQSNSLYGIGFYSLLGLLYLCGGSSRFLAIFQFYCFVLATAMSCYLGYILYAILNDFCVVCVATYAVNALLLLLNYCKMRQLSMKTPSPLQAYGGPGGPTLPSFSSKNAFKKNI